VRLSLYLTRQAKGLQTLQRLAEETSVKYLSSQPTDLILQDEVTKHDRKTIFATTVGGSDIRLFKPLRLKKKLK